MKTLKMGKLIFVIHSFKFAYYLIVVSMRLLVVIEVIKKKRKEKKVAIRERLVGF